MLPVASHMHSNYSGFHHFNPNAGYPSHTAIRYQTETMPANSFHQPPPPPNYKSDMHDHPSSSMMNHNQLMNSAPLPSVGSVPVSSQSSLNSINSLNNGGSGNDHAQQPNQDVSSYSSTVTPVSIPSPPASLPPTSSPLRFDIVLDAPTAAAQRIDETPMTYLNKGQYYSIIMQDQEKYDSELTSIVKVMFHDDAHRKMASTYWSFWLTQQSSPKSARAIDIDKAASTGISNVETKTFDRVQFKWNGKKGAKIFVRFNCLSTDFSRIKGVKGIPLRVHGAERKNKDDQKHLEKMCEKMRGKTQETTPMIMMYAPPNAVTSFTDITGNNDASDDDDVLSLSETLNNLDPEVEGGELMTLQLGKRRRFSMGSEFLEPLDRDPTYIPHIRKRRAVLCIYVKLPGETSYRAVYLNHLTVQDLISKLSDKLDFNNQQIADVIRYSKSRNLTVRVDDEYINQIEDEQDMEVEVQIGPDGSMILTLKY
nr:6272_t:CDS:10 [Entrophospora candida]